uniref:Surfeit 6 n=1 Tax=Lepisosteus oculatus TaxID=7918 RepID=W5M901_LEPOC
MASLVSKDAYLQKLASKVCATQNQEPRKRPFDIIRVFIIRAEVSREADQPKKKKKEKPNGKKTSEAKQRKPVVNTTKKGSSQPAPSKAQTTVLDGTSGTVLNGTAVKDAKTATDSFFAVDILRQRLHEKIEESRGNGSSKGLSAEDLAKKRARRKQERERKKRKRKEIRMKKLAEKTGEGETAEESKGDGAKVENPGGTGGRGGAETSIVFNKVDLSGEYVSKAQQKKEKRKKIKGNVTPLTGKNYKQLLDRVEARKAKVEELRSKDEEKAKELEEKIKWTNVLYKAEGLKIKDNEELLRRSLKRKEKMRAQKKRRWEQRSENVLEKMQNRQDKRRKNIQKKKQSKAEKRKDRARKKGRILPEDLKRLFLS